jgi:hypothetical protein
MWPTVLLEHPAVCEDPAVMLRLLATGRALGDEAAAAAAGRLRLALGREGECKRSASDQSGPEESARRRLCLAQAAFVERRGALLAEVTVADHSAWHGILDAGSPAGAGAGPRGRPSRADHPERPIESVLAPALRRAAAAGRLLGLRAVEVPGFRLEGGLLPALALCPALTRLRLGAFKPRLDRCVYVGDGSLLGDGLRDFGGLWPPRWAGCGSWTSRLAASARPRRRWRASRR